MGAGPAYIVLASWFPRKSRGVTTAIFNIPSQRRWFSRTNCGASIAWLGQEHWQAAHFVVPVAIAIIAAIIFSIFGAGRTYNEGLPPVGKILENENEELVVTKEENVNLTTWEIFRDYIMKDTYGLFLSLTYSLT